MSATAPLSGEAFYERAAAHAGLPFLRLDPGAAGDPVDPAAARLLPPWAARTSGVVPVRLEAGGRLLVAVSDPLAPLEPVERLAGRPAARAIATPDAIRRAQARVYRRGAALAAAAGIPFGPLDPDEVDLRVARRVSEHVCRRMRLLPLAERDGLVTVAVGETYPGVEAIAAALVRRPVALRAVEPEELDRAIAAAFAGVRARPADEEQRRRLGDLLVETGLLSRTQLVEALRLQERVGGRLGEVLLHAGLIDDDGLASSLAEQLRIPVADLAGVEPDAGALQLIPEPVLRRLRVVPLSVHEHVLYLAAADPLGAEEVALLREHTRLPLRTVLATRRSVEELLRRVFEARYVRVATTELLNRSPAESAYRTLSRGQKVVFTAIAVVFGLFLLWEPIATVIVFNIASILFYAGFSVYKFKLIYDALGHELELPVSDEEVAALDERTLPVYTVLVPLYREAAVAERIIRALARLDYPRAKLDVKLLVEEDDDETREALGRIELPPHLKLVIVPDGLPKTKPKACNYGLIQAEGAYVVIYDAEDRPEPDQLKKAVVAFRKAEERIVCIQCKLNYYNRDQNILTRWFTTEYSSWFDLFMPGLDAADSPIPLGGTSNHIRRDKLVELGAWDPFNVTEDADLGIRLHKAGYKTAIIDSTTFEEANSDLYNWIRQRSRWVKGYIQTWLVHMRHPVRLLRQMGWRSFLSFQFVVGGTFVGFLLNPFYWVLTSLWLMTQAGVIRELFPSFVYYAAAFALYIGNFVFTYVAVAGVVRRGYHGLVKYALLSPIYWGLMSIGAWKGLIQLVYRPSYWEKTVHGLDGGYAPPEPPAP